MIDYFRPEWIPSDPLILSLYIAAIVAGLCVVALIVFHGGAVAFAAWYLAAALGVGLSAGSLTYFLMQDTGSEMRTHSEEDTKNFDSLTLEKSSDNLIRISINVVSTKKQHSETLLLSEPIDPQVAQIAKNYNLDKVKVSISINKNSDQVFTDRELEYIYGSLLRSGIAPFDAPWIERGASSIAD